jgi:hypothetical protein
VSLLLVYSVSCDLIVSNSGAIVFDTAFKYHVVDYCWKQSRYFTVWHIDLRPDLAP